MSVHAIILLKEAVILMATLNDLSDAVFKKIDGEKKLSKAEMESKYSKGEKKNYKQGIYFLYDDSDNIIYVGKVGDYEKTSLRDRMVGHGSGSHKEKDKDWYDLVKEGKFHQFPSLTNKQLEQIERLMIARLKPRYNDVSIEDDEIDEIIKNI